MTIKPMHWSRRQFAQTIAAAAASSLIPSSAFAAPATQPEAIAFVATFGSAPSQPAAIHVFRVSSAGWTKLQVLPAPQPAHLELHPNLPILYTVHAVSLWDHLPRGAVSAYDIATNGKLTLRNTLPLSLSATAPRHSAISPDGRRLVVAATGAGIYNVLSIAPNGSLEAVTGIRKECGVGANAAQKLAEPGYVLFHPDGKHLLASDSGQRSLTLFSVADDGLHLEHRLQTLAAPSRIALSSCADWLYAEHPETDDVSIHHIENQQLKAMPPLEQLSGARVSALMADIRTQLHLEAASANGETPLHSHPCNCALRLTATAPRSALFDPIVFTSRRTRLIAAHALRGDVVQVPILAPYGALGHARTVARLPRISSMRLISA